MPSPSVSVIIVNWNQGRYLDRCLDSLTSLEYENFDISIVDNGSTDGSLQGIPGNYPGVNIIQFETNRGFCRAFNQGVDQTRGELVLSLNPDVFARRDFLQEMVDAMLQDERVGIVSAKLLRDDDPTLLDSTGLFISRLRRPYDRGQGEVDRGQYDRSLDIFGACGAAAFFRRSMLEDTASGGEYFDEQFFAYYEDADLAWRAQLRGWQARYAPGAVATHVRGWGDTLRKKDNRVKGNHGPRLALRNRYLMTLKNDAARYFLLDLPLILLAEFPRLAYMAVFAPQALLGLTDFLAGLKTTRAKRRLVRERRKIDDAAIRAWFKPQNIPH